MARAARSAARLVRLLTCLLPGFRDEALHRGRQCFFYKRAQILAADLWDAYGRPPIGSGSVYAFEDIGELTMFADYRVPQILAHLGVIEYEQALEAKIGAFEQLQVCQSRACVYECVLWKGGGCAGFVVFWFWVCALVRRSWQGLSCFWLSARPRLSLFLSPAPLMDCGFCGEALRFLNCLDAKSTPVGFLPGPRNQHQQHPLHSCAAAASASIHPSMHAGWQRGGSGDPSHMRPGGGGVAGRVSQAERTRHQRGDRLAAVARRREDQEGNPTTSPNAHLFLLTNETAHR